MDLATRIHQLAAQGNSKQQTMELLGFTRGRFDAVLELIPPVQWPARNRSNNARLANERRRGVFTPGMAKAQKLAAQAVRAKHAKTVRGVTGSIEQLIKHFNLQITGATVRRRMAKGQDLETALFTPRSTRSNLGKHLGAHTLSPEQWARRKQ